MPTFTRPQKKQILTHVLDDLLKDTEDDGTPGPIGGVIATERITDILDIISYSDNDFVGLKYQDDKSVVQTLTKAESNRLKLLKGYINWRTYIGQSVITKDDWMALTEDQINDFRVTTTWFGMTTNGTSILTAPTPGTGSKRDLVADFKRGIKRDMSYFPTLKQDKQWDNWNRATIAQAQAQDVSNVLNPKYSPNDPTAIALFHEQQKYMYAAFERHLQTDKGKALVRAHHSTSNAQAIYKELSEYALQSTKASLDSASLLAYITSAKLGDGKWKGTTHAFILHWQDQVRLFGDLVGTHTYFADDLLRTMLENAVTKISELRSVKAQADQHRTQTGKVLTYPQYCQLVLSAAQQYDAQFDPTPPINKSRTRQVYEHDIIDNAFDYEPHDIDSHVHDILEVNQTSFVRNPSLKKSQWDRLSSISEAQTIWDSLPAEAKKIILEPRLGGPPPPRQTNLHEISAFDYLQSRLPDDDHGDDGHDTQTTDTPSNASDNDSGSQLLAHMTKRAPLPPQDIQRILSSSLAKKPAAPAQAAAEVTINGKIYRQANTHNIVYSASNHRSTRRGALVDRGANGGIAGDDVRIIDKSGQFVDVQGIDNHQLVDIPLVTAGAVVRTQRGDIIAIMHQYAHMGKGKTIHSSGQLEWFRQQVDDKSIRVGGQQRITTHEGYVIPINIRSGLPYVSMRPYTDTEWEDLPHVILTSPEVWSPNVLDHDLDDNEQWFDAISSLPEDITETLFDEYGDYRHKHVVNEHMIHAPDLDHYVIPTKDFFFEVHEREIDAIDPREASSAPRTIQPKEPDYATYRPNFCWLSADIIKRTFQTTTQYARIPMSTFLRKHYKAPNPAFNVHRRAEPVATDTVYADTPAIDSGATSAQFFVGTESLVCDVYGMQTDKQFVNTLEDNIRRRGAPTRLLSDRAQVEISKKAQDILRTFVIGDWQSEPHQQHQNPAERRYQDVKRTTNTVMDRTGSPANTWLLALMYVCFVLNFTATASLAWRTPMSVLVGSTSDISILLRFGWWEPVYYKLDDSDFPSDSPELLGRMVGFSENVGHAMTYKILTDGTDKIIHRSNVRTALDLDAPNVRTELPDGETEPDPPQILKSVRGDSIGQAQLEYIDPTELIGRTFLTPPQEDGQRFRARIVRAIEDHETDLDDDPDRIKFLCSVNDDTFEEVMAYNDIVNFIEKDEEDGTVWKFKRITAHEGPITRRHPNWKGSEYNVMVEWEDGSITTEPLGILAADDPVSCAIYAKKHDLLALPGWKRFKGIAKRQKKFLRMANQAKLRSFRTAPRFKYGFEIPRTFDHAKRLDDKHGTTKWQTATELEFAQLDEYDTFTNLGKGGKPPSDEYKKIRVHLVYDVKHDGRHKARCVADGHLTDVPIDSVYSGVVSLRGIRMLIFLAELNQLETWATDIGNAYLEAETSEKLYIIAGPEFGIREGHTLVIFKALYGLRTSGLRWHERLSIVLRSLGFEPCKAEPDIWLRRDGDVYEYIGVYVDDLAIAMRDPQAFIDVLVNDHKFKLKGTGPIQFHLGCDFFRDEDGTLCMAPRKYIDKMIQNYERMFGEKPRMNVYSPLEKGDHPELDESEFLEPDDVTKYQSIVGSLQWAISLGRFDVATAVMTLSGFRALPRKGHLERAKRVCGYLSRMKHAVIRFRVEEPDYSDLPPQEYNWSHSVYGDVREQLPEDAPTPLGRFVTLTHFVDANLMHCMVTGRSVTGILHLANQTPIDWFSKKQATVETATYGSEFVAARTCVEQVMDLRTTLRYLGVPIRDKSYMFGDNESVVGSATKVHAKLHKRHNALSFHRVREAVASGMVAFFHVTGIRNPSDILSKHWAYADVWKTMQPLLFWQGDTANIDGIAPISKCI
jgi:hypothetical protein